MKAAEALPGITGAIISWIVNRAADLVGWEEPVVIGEPNSNDNFKPWRVDWDKNVNASIRSGLYDRVDIPIWKLVEGHKKKRISIESIENKKFYEVV